MNLLFVYSSLDHPVYFLSKDGSSLKPSICFPDWGCTIIFNKEKEKGLLEISTFIEESLAYLLNISVFPDILNDPLQITAWREYVTEFMLSRHLQSSISFTMSYIISLQNILSSFANISIAFEFQNLVLNIRDALKSCVKLVVSRRLIQAFEQATITTKLSESAFFHPSLLGKLYFPDEHKYAVYLPLLLPTFLPVIIGTVKLIFGK
jgi:phosphatidylinositol glycan class S